MEISQNWGDVMLSFKASEKPSCCVLNLLEVGEWLLVNARKEGVTVVKSKEDECVNDFFECERISLILKMAYHYQCQKSFVCI